MSVIKSKRVYKCFTCVSVCIIDIVIVDLFQVLSSKLMPTTQDMGSKVGSQAFFEDFLVANGLSTVVAVLQPESLHQDINYVTRQGCYSVCLQLARYTLAVYKGFGLKSTTQKMFSSFQLVIHCLEF